MRRVAGVEGAGNELRIVFKDMHCLKGLAVFEIKLKNSTLLMVRFVPRKENVISTRFPLMLITISSSSPALNVFSFCFGPAIISNSYLN